MQRRWRRELDDAVDSVELLSEVGAAEARLNETTEVVHARPKAWIVLGAGVFLGLFFATSQLLPTRSQDGTTSQAPVRSVDTTTAPATTSDLTAPGEQRQAATAAADVMPALFVVATTNDRSPPFWVSSHSPSMCAATPGTTPNPDTSHSSPVSPGRPPTDLCWPTSPASDHN